MSFCTNCGNAISDDSNFCTACGSKILNIENIKNTSEQANSTCSTTSAIVVESKKKSNKKSLIIITVLILLIIGCFGSQNGETSKYKKYRTYKKAIEAFCEGLNEADSMKFCTSMLTEDMIDSIGESYLAGIESTALSLNEVCEEVLNKKPNWKITPKSKTKLKESEINEIENYYSTHLYTDIKIEEAYNVKAKLKVCGQSDTVYIDVIKIKGEGWKVSAQILSLDTLLTPFI